MKETYISSRTRNGVSEKISIKKFDSFEAMENDQMEYFASLTPEELLKNLKTLSMAAFGIKSEDALDQPERKLKFDDMDSYSMQ